MLAAATLLASMGVLLALPAAIMRRVQDIVFQQYRADAISGLVRLRSWQRTAAIVQTTLAALLYAGCVQLAQLQHSDPVPWLGSKLEISALLLIAAAALTGGALMPLGCRRVAAIWTSASWKWWQQLRYQIFWHFMFLGRGPALVYGTVVLLAVAYGMPWMTEHRFWVWALAPVSLMGLYTAQLMLTPLAVRLLFGGRAVAGPHPVRRYRYRSYGSRIPLAFAGGLTRRQASITYNDALEQMLTPEEFEAVILHEFAHILRNDVFARLSIVLQGILYATVIALPVAEGLYGIPEVSVGAALLAPFLGVLASTVVLRQRYWEQELDADRFAAEQVGAHCYAQALIKMHRMLRLPGEWSVGDRRRAMHPSLYRRLREIGYHRPELERSMSRSPSRPTVGAGALAQAEKEKSGNYLEFYPLPASTPQSAAPPSDEIPPRFRPRFRYSPRLRQPRPR